MSTEEKLDLILDVLRAHHLHAPDCYQMEGGTHENLSLDCDCYVTEETA